MSDEIMVSAVGLTKSFGETKALDGLDLQVRRGSVLGVLGPNGAGKTTAVRVLTTLLRSDAGVATIDGVDVAAEPGRVRSRIGVTGQYAAVDEALTARENLELMARFHRRSKSVAKARASELLDRFDLVDAADRVAKGFSGGMRRRLDIGMSLVAEPRVLFLDEPTTGLDPRSRLAMWELIGELQQSGMTTLLTTQYLDEADALADDIVVIDRGKAIATGTAAQLKEQIGGARAVLTLAPGADVGAAIVAIERLAKPGAQPLEADGSVSIAVHATTTTPDLVRDLDAAGIALLDAGVERPTLDDVFLTLTGEAAETDTNTATKAAQASNGDRS